MKKLLLLNALLLLLSTYIWPQISLQGIVLQKIDNYSPGDTINVYGLKKNSSGSDLYLVESGYGDKYIPDTKIRLLDADLDYWESIWFQHRSSQIRSKGWQKEYRELLENDYLDYIAHMDKNNLILNDPYLEDYLRQVVLWIHPTKLIRPKDKQIQVVIIKSAKPEIFAFNCGTIIMTTGKMAEFEDEEDLMNTVSQYVAHIVLEHNLLNLDEEIRAYKSAEFFSAFSTLASAIAMEISNIEHGTFFNIGDAFLVGMATAAISEAIIESAGANYSTDQMNEAGYYAKNRIGTMHANGFAHCSGREYGIHISPVLKSLAWQEYFQNNHESALSIMNRLFELGIEDEEDYLLMAKIYLARSDTEESNLQALEFILTAEQMEDFNFVEILLEKGIVLMRLDRYSEAKEEFKKFISIAEEVGGNPEDIQQAKRMIIKCDQLLGIR